MKKIKIYQPGLISLLLLPIMVFVYLLTFEINTNSVRQIQLNMPDVDSKSEMSFSIESLRKDIKVLNNCNYSDTNLLMKIDSLLNLKKNIAFAKNKPKMFQYGISVKFSNNFKYENFIDLLNICMKKNIDRYFIDLKNDEFIIADSVNEPNDVIAIDHGVIYDDSYRDFFKNDIRNLKVEPNITFNHILEYYGFKLLTILLLFCFLIYFSLRKSAKIRMINRV